MNFSRRFPRKFFFQTAVNARIYGENFNVNFFNGATRFRDKSNPNLFGNYQGDFLYPLINTFRPFEQWSVYTEYLNSRLSAFSIQLTGKKNVFKSIYTKVDLETNAIFSQQHSDHLYFFGEVGLGLELPGQINFEVYITNKLMNLDVHFQTFYQNKTPVLGFSIIRQVLSYQ